MPIKKKPLKGSEPVLSGNKNEKEQKLKEMKWSHCSTHNRDYPSGEGCPECNNK